MYKELKILGETSLKDRNHILGQYYWPAIHQAQYYPRQSIKEFILSDYIVAIWRVKKVKEKILLP